MQESIKTTPILTSINSACSTLNIGRTYAYELINSGRLATVKLGRRTLIKVASLEALIRESEVAK